MVLGLLVGLALVADRSRPPTLRPRRSSLAAGARSTSCPPAPVWCRPRSASTPTPSCSAAREVLGAVADVLGVDTGAARDSLSVTASPNSHVLHVTVTAPSAPAAAEAANAAAAALVARPPQRPRLPPRRPAPPAAALVTGQEDLLAQEQRDRLVIPATDELFALGRGAPHRSPGARGGASRHPPRWSTPRSRRPGPTTPTARSRWCRERCSGSSPGACSAPCRDRRRLHRPAPLSTAHTR